MIKSITNKEGVYVQHSYTVNVYLLFHTWNFIHPHILSILSITQVSVKHTLGILQNAHSHRCIHTVCPSYLRLLLLLGCDPVRPGWSGLWRFWGEIDNIALFIQMLHHFICRPSFQTWSFLTGKPGSKHNDFQLGFILYNLIKCCFEDKVLGLDSA